MEIIKVEGLKKVYRVPKRRPGFLNSFKDLIKKEWESVTALKGIDLSINEGEIVGYIGPNGAGKSTTIKIMSGILYPTSGIVVVDGLVPYEKKKENARRITLIAGQRSVLYWDLPVVDTFELMKRIYKIPDDIYKKNLDMFSEILDINQLMDVPTRQLSLGQRMRADFVAAMLHNPRIIYLDEPTIGLDIIAKEHIREFIKHINRERKATIILTSHDIADIERICSRVVVIDHGEIIYSGTINTLKDKYIQANRILRVKLEDKITAFKLDGIRVERNEEAFDIYFNRENYSPTNILDKLLENRLKVVDFTLIEPSLEETVKLIYKSRGKSNE